MNVPKLRFKEFNDKYNITKISEIIDIIEHKIQKTSYLFLYVILYHIYKLLELNKHATINDGTRINIKRKTVNKLNQYKIYTLSHTMYPPFYRLMNRFWFVYIHNH